MYVQILKRETEMLRRSIKESKQEAIASIFIFSPKYLYINIRNEYTLYRLI